MKIAIAVEHFSPNKGGAEKHVWNMSSWLLDHGHELDIFTVGKPLAMPRARIHVLDVAHARGRSRQFRFASALTDALSGQSFDVVYGVNHVWPCDILTLHGGVHLAFEYYNALSSFSSFHRLLKTMSYCLLPKYRALRANEIMQFADEHRHFIAVSQRVANDMIHYYPQVRDRCHVVHRGIDLGKFNLENIDKIRLSASTKFRTGKDGLVFLFISNNYRLKGLYDLIKALPSVRKGLHKPFQLLVIGRGREGPYRRLAFKMGVADCIRFLGATENVLEVYAASDLLIHPSYYDSFGNVCLEAMACGLPVVVSKNSGVSEIMKDGDGAVLIDMPCACSQLAEAIIQAADPDFREAARLTQSRRARAFPIENNFNEMLCLFEMIARTKKEPSAN